MPKLDTYRQTDSFGDQDKRRILVSSTTLRDGLQTSTAAHVSLENRVQIAQLEEALGVDICEAGFPGKENANSVRVIEEVARNTQHMIIAAMAGSDEVSINAAIKAMANGGLFLTNRAQLNVLLRVSENLRKFGQLQPVSEEQFLKNLEKAVELSVAGFAGKTDLNGQPTKLRLMYYLEQATNAYEENRDFVEMVCRKLVALTYEAAEQTGRSEDQVEVKLSLCDTNGIAVQGDYGKMFNQVNNALFHLAKRGMKSVLSTHAHDDLGLAVANTVDAVVAGGAGQIEVTMNGLGEGAGNANLATVVALLDHYQERFGLVLGVKKTALMTQASNVVAALTEIPQPVNMPVVGKQVSVLATTAGLHSAAEQNAQREALRKSRELGYQVEPVQVYRALNTALWGNFGELHLNSEQGVDAFRTGLKELNVYVDAKTEKQLFEDIRTGYGKSRNLQQYLMEVLCQPEFVRKLEQVVNEYNGVTYHLEGLKYAGVDKTAGGGSQEVEVEVCKKERGEEEKIVMKQVSSRGTIEAFCKAMKEIIALNQPGFGFDIVDYAEQKVDLEGNNQEDNGAASMVVATVLIRDLQGNRRRGFGMSTDSIEAKAKAVMNGLALIKWQKDEKGRSLPPQTNEE